MMRIRGTLTALAVLLALVACAPAAIITPIPTLDLDTTPSEVTIIKASAVVVPAQEARLGFRLAGMLNELNIVEGDTVESGHLLATLSSPDLEYGLLQAEAALRSAEFDYAYWEFPRTNRPPERRELAEWELITVQRALDTARAELAQATLVAPFAATVISVEVQPGEYVNPGQVVIILAKLDQLRIKTIDLSELNVTKLEVGQSAMVYVEALNQEFPGKVTAISPISDTIGGDVVFEVTIKLDEQPKALRWGMSSDVEINVE